MAGGLFREWNLGTAPSPSALFGLCFERLVIMVMFYGVFVLLFGFWRGFTWFRLVIGWLDLRLASGVRR